jgi:hypothetical protein
MGVYSQLKRIAGTNRAGQGFSSVQLQLVWDKARLAPGYDPAVRRLDACGAFIDRAKYGDTTSETGTGWEVDHIRPVSVGGTDDLSNLQALQWRNNRRKGDQFPIVSSQYAAIVASRN